MICATAEVSAVVTRWSVPKVARVGIGENDRLVVKSFAVIVTEKLLCAARENIGSGLSGLIYPIFIGVIFELWYMSWYDADCGKIYFKYMTPVVFVHVIVKVTLEPEIADCAVGVRVRLVISADVNQSNHKSPRAMI